MISLNFGLWWSGAKLSYLRYLTFKTLRHFHPHSRIQLFTNNKYNENNDQKVSQEFNNDDAIKRDYFNELEKLDVEIVRVNYFSKFAPNHQSDFFRWWHLKENGGFYLDTDQIILKSFKGLPLKQYNFIYSSYKVNSPLAPSGTYSPVGVLGATKDSKILKHIACILPDYLNEEIYDSIGPDMFRDVIQKIDMSQGFNAPSKYFYLATIGDQTKGIYSGKMELSNENYALHWFGGYNDSQKFNRKYTEEFAKSSDDTISRFLRKKKII
jgi:mannosyltransferase OCH1-like enzyme